MRDAGGCSAIELAAALAETGHTLVYWYGYDHPDERVWAMDDIQVSDLCISVVWRSHPRLV